MVIRRVGPAGWDGAEWRTPPAGFERHLMTDYAVFFDPSRKRWSWIKRISTVLGLLSVVIVSTFLVSIFVTTPFLPTLKGITRDLQRSFKPFRALRHQQKKSEFLLRKDRN